MNRSHRDRRWQSPKDRARVAAELMEEAASLSETGLIATPAPIRLTADRAPASPAAVSMSEPTPAPTPGLPALPEPAAASELAVCTAARTARSDRDRESALAALDRALTASPDDSALLLGRAGLLAALGNYGAARRDLDQLLRVHPSHGEGLTALGVLQSRRGLWVDAAAQLQHAVAVDAARPAAWYYLGEALNHLDDLSGALAAFGRAAELDPGNSKAFYGQGIVLDRLNRPADATQMYRRARDVTRR